MGYCGVPTLACIILLLLLAALYAGVTSTKDEDDSVKEYGGAYKVQVRASRSLRFPNLEAQMKSRGKSGGNTSNRGKSETIGDSQRQSDSSGITRPLHIPAVGNDRLNDRRPRPEGGKRPRPGNNKDGLPAGVNRKMMRLAEKIHTASTPFSVRLYNALISKSQRNFVISPFSVHTALTMTMLGAKGRTEKEMFVALGHKLAKLRNKKPHQAYKGLLTSLQSVHEEVKVTSANAVFVKPSIPLEDTFRQGLTQFYNATFDSFQLQHPQGPEAPINSWVSNVTSNKIQNLLSAGSITPLTALVLINAVYFKGPWSKPFTASYTKPSPFKSLADGVQTVDMMSGSNPHSYANHHDTEVIELLYKGDRIAMYILLPNIGSNITHLQQKLTKPERPGHNPIDPYFENLRQEYLRLFLPKFRIETDAIELKQPLKDIGIVRAFDADQADFTGISSIGGLHIDKVFHKAFIDVNENGTEAAAATAVVVGVRSSPRAREVKVDRPFMFIIRDKALKEILFIGAYVGSGVPYLLRV